MKTEEEQIEELKATAVKLQKQIEALEKSKQWEPRGGAYGCDMVVRRRTKEAAVKTRDALLSYNRLLDYVDEFGGDWQADWEDGKQLKFTVYYGYASSSWDTDCKWLTRLSGAVYMSQDCAVGLANKLNLGEVVL